MFVLALSACGGGGGSAPPGNSFGPPVGSGTGSGPSSPSGSPASSPSASSSSTPVPQSAQTYHGCSVFPGGSYYSGSIAGASIDDHSSAYISGAVQAGNTSGFFASTGYERVNLASNSTPLLQVHQKTSYHHFPVPYPWRSSFYIEKLVDAHAIVVDTQSCHVYESYDTTYSGALAAFSGANWSLTKPFVPLAPDNPSSMASGLSLFAGMVQWEDFQSGAIRHALNWAAPDGTVSHWNFVVPASDTGGSGFDGRSSYQIPFGARLRLRASFDTRGWGPQATMVANAMKTYGIYLADVGTSGNGLYFANTVTGQNPWNLGDLSALGKITISDFDVIALPPIQTIPH
ncbi:MAG TPA: hypothetical protein VGZ02_13630 [Candidatus Baltobacteraceae bacterium]|nr:hypothetical protein [Candidatus Baltobacteraceae bacterium]